MNQTDVHTTEPEQGPEWRWWLECTDCDWHGPVDGERYALLLVELHEHLFAGHRAAAGRLR